jgi:hypothetical protein
MGRRTTIGLLAASLPLALSLLVGCGGGETTDTAATASAPSPTAVCARIPVKSGERLVDRAGPGRAPALRRSAHGTAQLVKCSFPAKGVHLDLNLDLAPNSRQRFDNRVMEMTQFSIGRPATLPRPVPGVGDPSSGNEGAQWIPALDQLLAYRPGRYLIVDFSVESAPDSANRHGAAALARLAFPLLPRSRHANAQRPTPG